MPSTLWLWCAMIWRRKALCPAIISSPFQNSTDASGVRTSSPGFRKKSASLRPLSTTQVSRPPVKCARQLPVQPMEYTTPHPAPVAVRLKNGSEIMSELRPPRVARFTALPSPSGSSTTSKSWISALEPRRRRSRYPFAPLSFRVKSAVLTSLIRPVGALPSLANRTTHSKAPVSV